jgi:hypothetical protein
LVFLDYKLIIYYVGKEKKKETESATGKTGQDMK